MTETYILIALDVVKRKGKEIEEKHQAEIEDIKKDLKLGLLLSRITILNYALAKSSYDGDNVDLTQLQLKEAEDEMKKERPSFSFHAKHVCGICNDSGVVDGRICDCVFKLAESIEMNQSGLLQTKNINNIEDMFYQNEQMNKLVSFLKRWCETFPNVIKNDILLIGQTGIGKTYLAKAVGKTILDKKYDSVFVNAFDLNEDFLKERTNFDHSKSYVDKYLTCKLLIIDDLGVEPKYNNVTDNFLYVLLSIRQENNLNTIITSNLQINAIEELYGQRIFSRLCNKNCTSIFNLRSDDLRLKTI